jgi:hypothetical protein
MGALNGYKTYLVVVGVLATGAVDAGIAAGTFDLAVFWDYLLGGAGLAALRHGIK